MITHKVINNFKKKSSHCIIEYFNNFKALKKNNLKPVFIQNSATDSIEGYRSEKLSELEALLFLADEPLLPKKISLILGCKTGGETRKLLKDLQKIYIAENNSFHIEEVAGGFQLLSKAEFHPWLARLSARNDEPSISSAMKETLAIVAYKQPITRADIEHIRGVNSSEVIRNLIEKNLLRIVGRDSSLGRPVLYGTTRKFLQIYGLKSLRDLPKKNEFGTPRDIADEDVNSAET